MYVCCTRHIGGPQIANLWVVYFMESCIHTVQFKEGFPWNETSIRPGIKYLCRCLQRAVPALVIYL
jgi:hypothetical protein